MKLIILMLLLLVGVIISKCRCRVVEGVRPNLVQENESPENESPENESPENDSIKYAQNQLITGPDSWYSLPNQKDTLPFTVGGQNPLFYVCGNASGLFSRTGGHFEWSSNVCENNNCTLNRCINDGDDDDYDECIQARNNSPVRIGTYCDKYDESGGSDTLNSNFESYVKQFISCPNEGDEIYGLYEIDNHYEFLPINYAKYGLCNGVFKIYDGPFPKGNYASGNLYEGSHGSGTAFTCEEDNSEKTRCNRNTDRLWQILT